MNLSLLSTLLHLFLQGHLSQHFAMSVLSSSLHSRLWLLESSPLSLFTGIVLPPTSLPQWVLCYKDVSHCYCEVSGLPVCHPALVVSWAGRERQMGLSVIPLALGRFLEEELLSSNVFHTAFGSALRITGIFAAINSSQQPWTREDVGFRWVWPYVNHVFI